MAISVIGGSAAASPSVGVPAGYGLLAGGYASTGRHQIANPRPGVYNIQCGAGTNARTVVELLTSGTNSVNTAFTVAQCNGLGGTSNFNINSGTSYVATYNRWATTTTGLAQSITAVAFFNGIYFAGNSIGQIYTSTDGLTWTYRAQPVANAKVWAFTWNQSTSTPLYSVVGYTTSTYLWATSGDGTTWTNRSATDNLKDIVFGNGVWVANYENSYLKQSTNGTSWNTTPYSGQGNTLNAVAHNGLSGASSVFVSVGNTGSIVSSNADGTTWTARTSGVGQALNSVAYGNGLFVAVGDAGVILTSPDGTNWTTRAGANAMTTYNFLSVAYGNGRWIATTSAAVSTNAGGGLYTSTDGITWRPIGDAFAYATAQPRQLVYGGNKWIAGTGFSATISYSGNGLDCAPVSYNYFTDAYATLN